MEWCCEANFKVLDFYSLWHCWQSIHYAGVQRRTVRYSSKRWTEVIRTMDRCCVRPWCLLLITCSPLVRLSSSSTSLSATTESDGATAWHTPCTMAAASRAILMDARKRFDVQFFMFSQNQASRRAQDRLKLVDQFITYSQQAGYNYSNIEPAWKKKTHEPALCRCRLRENHGWLRAGKAGRMMNGKCSGHDHAWSVDHRSWHRMTIRD